MELDKLLWRIIKIWIFGVFKWSFDNDFVLSAVVTYLLLYSKLQDLSRIARGPCCSAVSNTPAAHADSNSGGFTDRAHFKYWLLTCVLMCGELS